MNFQSKVVQLSSSYIPKFDAMILKRKEKSIKISPSQICKFQTSIPLRNVFSAQQYCLPLCLRSKKMEMGVTEKKMIAQFQLGYLFSL